MDGRHAQLVDPDLDRVPGLKRIERTDPRVARAHRAAPAGRLLPLGWAVALGAGWPLAFAIATALEPVPDHPEASQGLLASTTAFAFMIAFWATVLLAVNRRPSAALAGAAAGTIGVAMAVTCPVSGHHELGNWWFAQLGLMVVMLGIALAALRHRPPAST